MNFDKNFHTYDKHATVQKIVASNLTRFIESNLKDKSVKSVFEIGCGTGIFTRKFLEKFSPDRILLSDYFDTKEYLKDIKYEEFYQGDIEKAIIPKVDIIISSSALQWVNNLELVISNLGASSNKLGFSIYLKENLDEINKHFNISLNYFSLIEIENILKRYYSKVVSLEETHKIEFSTPFEALRHLKNTGVTGLKKSSVKEIKSFPYTSLTYKVGYFYCEK